jgi:N-acetylglutamate synthase
MENIEIIHFSLKYYKEIFSLWKKTKGIGITAADSKENLKKYLDINNNSSFIAILDKKVIGTILAGHDGRRAYIYHLAVEEAHRKKGVGKLLFQKAIEEIKKTGITKCNLFVFKDNYSGKEIWEKIGFVLREDLDLMSFEIK